MPTHLLLSSHTILYLSRLCACFHMGLEAGSGVALLFWFFGSFAVAPVGLIGAPHEGLG
jgi:hypothetical protein